MKKERRYDLDWLRVMVFALLIFYHVGMFFVPWGWHIKNNQIYEELKWPMLFINQWRLPILFVISGMGTAFALSFRSIGQFISERNMRLGLPLIFGMLIIVPPQVYIERLADGDYNGTFLEYMFGFAFHGVYPEGNISWHHLWFLPYLLIFSIILSPVFLYIRNHANSGWLDGLRNMLTGNPFMLYLFVIPLYLYESLLEPFFPITHNLVWDWFNFISSLTLFFYGFLLITIKEAFWNATYRIRKYSLWIGIICFSGLLVRWLFFEDSILVHFIEAALKVINLWSWILTIFAYAAIYLNKSSKLLAYCNRAVYPFYILHQTITIILGYYLMRLEWSFFTKSLIMLTGTFFFSFLIYEFGIRRIGVLHPLFGLKSRQTVQNKKPNAS